MMTDHERQQGFYAAIRAAELTYGLTIQAEVNIEPLGEAVLMRPRLVIVPLAGWQNLSTPFGHAEAAQNRDGAYKKQDTLSYPED